MPILIGNSPVLPVHPNKQDEHKHSFHFQITEPFKIWEISEENVDVSTYREGEAKFLRCSLYYEGAFSIMEPAEYSRISF